MYSNKDERIAMFLIVCVVVKSLCIENETALTSTQSKAYQICEFLDFFKMQKAHL